MSAASATAFWDSLERLLRTERLVVDRPRGSTHPRFPDFVYPLDYGYLEGTSGGDGGGIDVWAGSADRAALTGIVCTVDIAKRDTEIKLLAGCVAAEIEAILEAQNSGPQAAILLMNPLIGAQR